MKSVFPKNPSICAPLTGRRLVDILEEITAIITKQPDMLEWRADFFEGIRRPHELIDALAQIRKASGQLPLMFTLRSPHEGGNVDLSLTRDEKLSILSTVCQSKLMDYVDFELSNTADDIRTIRTITRASGVTLILSYHNFTITPDEDLIREKFMQVVMYEGDVGKVAVMPNSLEDVLDFMKTSLQIQRDIQVPMIAIAMGELGAISRLLGWMFGSQVTFAIGEHVSAPGQLPISDVQTVIDIVRKSQRK